MNAANSRSNNTDSNNTEQNVETKESSTLQQTNLNRSLFSTTNSLSSGVTLTHSIIFVENRAIPSRPEEREPDRLPSTVVRATGSPETRRRRLWVCLAVVGILLIAAAAIVPTVVLTQRSESSKDSSAGTALTSSVSSLLTVFVHG